MLSKRENTARSKKINALGGTALLVLLLASATARAQFHGGSSTTPGSGGSAATPGSAASSATGQTSATSMPGGSPTSNSNDSNNCYSNSNSPQSTPANQNQQPSSQQSNQANNNHLISNPSQYLGQVVGSGANAGSCASLVQTADPSIGKASTWTKGEQVEGATDIQPGTPIATFNYNNGQSYGPDSDPGGVSGGSHTAIYMSQNASGVQVINQWVGQPATVSTIPWSSWSGNSAEGGSKYYVIQ